MLAQGLHHHGTTYMAGLRRIIISDGLLAKRSTLLPLASSPKVGPVEGLARFDQEPGAYPGT